MAGEVTNEDVQQSRERVDRLNAELAAAKAANAAGARSGENEYRKAQLDQEADRLQAELDALRASVAPAPAPATTAPTRERPAPEPITASSPEPIPAPTTDQR